MSLYDVTSIIEHSIVIYYLSKNAQNVAFLSCLAYFADVMLTYERYQALCAINIRVPGEPRNEAKACIQASFAFGGL